MSNYTNENLIIATAKTGERAIKIGDKIFVGLDSGGSSTDYYKCASVDSNLSTWTGYKAILSGGVYSFESTVTSGLTYSVITPGVGKVYADGALIQANLYEGLPLNGLLVSAMSDTSWVAGQSVSAWGDFLQSDTSKQPVIATIGGVTGIKARNGDNLTCSASALTDDFTFAIKFYKGQSASSITMILAGGNYGPVCGAWEESGITSFNLAAMGGPYSCTSNIDFNSLNNGEHTFVISFKNSTKQVKFYIDGQLEDDTQTYEVSFNYSNSYSYNQEGTSDNLILGLAIYNRVLSAAEIASINW